MNVFKTALSKHRYSIYHFDMSLYGMDMILYRWNISQNDCYYRELAQSNAAISHLWHVV